MTNPWHIITAEYPPQRGGVSDYTRLVAEGLAEAGDVVHVWCRRSEVPAPVSAVNVHRVFDGLGLSALRRLGRQLNEHPAPRRLLVQWVPHAFGYKSMNIGCCAWLFWRARIHRDQIDVMVHEPFVAFREGNFRQDVAAFVHRLMMVLLLGAARRVWISIPAWEKCLRPYLLGRRVRMTWLPIPANIRPTATLADIHAIRERLCIAPDGQIVGHFGTYGSLITRSLEPLIMRLLSERADAMFLLIGNGSADWSNQFLERHPELRDRVIATGDLDADALSAHLSVCDVLVQPYPDGISTRRSSVMAAFVHGRPVVSNAGHLTESFWQTSDAIRLVAAGDDVGARLADAVMDLLANPVTCRAVGSAAAALYRSTFDVSHTIANLRKPAGPDYACVESPASEVSTRQPCA